MNGAAGLFGSIIPAMWSFQLALRSRGLGSCYTTLHLVHEQEAADLLEIPPHLTQAGLLPVASTKGTDFKVGARKPLDPVLNRATDGLSGQGNGNADGSTPLSGPPCCRPTHTAVASCGVNPTNQALALLPVVPVLPALGRPSASCARTPVPPKTTCCIAYVASAATPWLNAEPVSALAR